MRDPHPLNELGAGVLDPGLESRLAAQGVTFARRVASCKGHTSLMLFSRPVVQTLTAMRDHGRKLAKAKIESAPVGG